MELDDDGLTVRKKKKESMLDKGSQHWQILISELGSQIFM